jgi:type IX secretion system PorP/SprF family membrane protein
MRKRLLRIAVCSMLLTAGSVSAQDVHFSQFNETPQLLNPATTGVYNGYIRGIVNYRNQWSAMGNAYTTMAASVDVPMFDYNARKAHLGLGINFFNDKAGDASFGLSQANICIAGILPVSRESKFSLGIQIGGAQHKANMQALSWGSQYDGTGFDPTMSSNETATMNSFMYADIGAGLFYEFFSGKATLDRNEEKRFGIGASYFHINRPTQKYFTVSEKLYSKLVVNVNGYFDKTGTRLSVIPSAIYFMQGPSSELTFGCALRYRLRNGTKITGFYSETGLALGLHYRLGDAIIPSLNFEIQNFSIGLAYDLNVSSYKAASNMNGGFEIALRYNIDKGALFKQKNVL